MAASPSKSCTKASPAAEQLANLDTNAAVPLRNNHVAVAATVAANTR